MKIHNQRAFERNQFDKVYMAGFHAKRRDDCPYPVPEALCHQRLVVSCKITLTPEDKFELARLNAEMELHEWHRWVHGFWNNDDHRTLDMHSYTYVKILTGPFAGDKVKVISLGSARDLEMRKAWDAGSGQDTSPNATECWSLFGEGVWHEKLGQRFNIHAINGVPPSCEWAGTPFDKFEQEIFPGDVVMYAMRDLTVSELLVEKIEYKNGDTVMSGIDLHTGKKTKNSYPRRCVKLSGKALPENLYPARKKS